MSGDAYSFELAWRWTRPTHNVLPPDVMAQIKPIDGAALPGGLVDDERHLHAAAFDDIRRGSAEISPDEGDVSVRRGAEWLRRLPVGASEQIVVRWDSRLAVETTWDVFTRFWDDFCYPSSDDVEVFPPSGQWLLLYHHFEQFEWGRPAGAALGGGGGMIRHLRREWLDRLMLPRHAMRTYAGT